MRLQLLIKNAVAVLVYYSDAVGAYVYYSMLVSNASEVKNSVVVMLHICAPVVIPLLEIIMLVNIFLSYYFQILFLSHNL